MQTSQCRKCDLPVVWAKSAKGSNMMFDAEPLDPTTATVEELEEAKWVLTEKDGVTHAKFGPRHDGPRWTSHFDTCEVAEGRGPKTQASVARKFAASAADAKPAVTVKPKGASLQVTVLFGDILFSGTCYVVPKEPEAFAPADEDHGL